MAGESGLETAAVGGALSYVPPTTAGDDVALKSAAQGRRTKASCWSDSTPSRGRSTSSRRSICSSDCSRSVAASRRIRRSATGGRPPNVEPGRRLSGE